MPIPSARPTVTLTSGACKCEPAVRSKVMLSGTLAPLATIGPPHSLEEKVRSFSHVIPELVKAGHRENVGTLPAGLDPAVFREE